MANSAINEVDGEDLYDEPVELTVLSEISKSDRFPPVLVRMKDERQTILVLSRTHRLNKRCEMRRYGQEGDGEKERLVEGLAEEEYTVKQATNC